MQGFVLFCHCRWHCLHLIADQKLIIHHFCSCLSIHLSRNSPCHHCRSVSPDAAREPLGRVSRMWSLRKLLSLLDICRPFYSERGTILTCSMENYLDPLLLRHWAFVWMEYVFSAGPRSQDCEFLCAACKTWKQMQTSSHKDSKMTSYWQWLISWSWWAAQRRLSAQWSVPISLSLHFSLFLRIQVWQLV